jgi:mRNA-degrading endonuclease toxin of MazEF toxin-antitoxin module
MARGDIVLVDLPHPMTSAGHEQFGNRPAVVLQEDGSTATLSTIVLVPVTGKLAASRFLYSFLIEPSRTNGLDKRSIVLTHQIVATDKRRIGRKIGKLSRDDLATLEANLRQLLGL